MGLTQVSAPEACSSEHSSILDAAARVEGEGFLRRPFVPNNVVLVTGIDLEHFDE